MAQPPQDSNASSDAPLPGKTRIMRVPPTGAQRTAAGASGKNRAVRTGDSIRSDREKLGLSEFKPSDLVQGLDVVAKRAENIEARDQARKRAGNQMNQNVALKTDETGRKWSRNVLLGILGVGLLAAAIFGVMLITSNRKPVDHRQLALDTSRQLASIRSVIPYLEPLDSGTLSVDEFKTNLQKAVNTYIENTKEKVEAERKAKGIVPPHLSKQLSEATALKELKDAWGNPLQIELLGHTAKIGSVRSEVKPIEISLK